MAKVFGPALSVDAKGTIAKGITFQGRPKGSAVIQRPVASRTSLDNPTASQQAQRTIIGNLVATWQGMDSNDHALWDLMAEEAGLNIKGYHYFMKKGGVSPYSEPGLVGYWRFEKGSGSVAFDFSGQNNHGLLKPSYPSNSPSWVTGKNKYAGNAMSFDGVDDYVDCGAGSSLDITDVVTFEAWVNVKSSSGGRYISGKSTDEWVIYFEDGSTAPRVYMEDVSPVVLIADTSLNLNQWYHVAFTYDKDGGSNNRKIYINGVLDKQDTATGALGTSTLPFLIGAYSTTPVNLFNGSIDEVRIYNRALSATEIQKLYDLTK